MAATDERAIHEFPTGTIDDNSLLIMDRPTATPGEYETEKFAIANLGLKLLGGIDFPSNLDTEEQDIFGAINEVNAKAMNIAAEYDETASYSKGDYCIYQNSAYRCIKPSGTTTGTFVAADWTQIKVLAEVKANTEEIGLKQDATDNSLSTNNKTVVGAINELNSGKQDTLTVQTGTVSGETGTTILRQTLLKFGNVVFLTCDIKVATVVRWSTFATLPNAFAPANNNIYTMAINTGSSAGVQSAHVQISTGGNLAFGNTLPDANVQYSISAVWIVN